MRIGMGLAANRSVTESEMLLYVHATVAPFLLPQVWCGGVVLTPWVGVNDVCF